MLGTWTLSEMHINARGGMSFARLSLTLELEAGRSLKLSSLCCIGLDPWACKLGLWVDKTVDEAVFKPIPKGPQVAKYKVSSQSHNDDS